MWLEVIVFNISVIFSRHSVEDMKSYAPYNRMHRTGINRAQLDLENGYLLVLIHFSSINLNKSPQNPLYLQEVKQIQIIHCPNEI